MGGRSSILLVDLKSELFESAAKTAFPKTECMSEESVRLGGTGHGCWCSTHAAGSVAPQRPPSVQVRPPGKDPSLSWPVSLRSPVCFFSGLLLGMKFPGLPISPVDSEQVKGEEPESFSGPFVRLIFLPRHSLGGHLPRISEWNTSIERTNPEGFLLGVEGAHTQGRLLFP